MDNLDIFLLIIAIIVSYDITKEIFTIKKTSTSESEAKRFFENMCNSEYENSSLKFSIHKRGLALAKSKEEEKYELIPQSKLCELGLS